MNYCIYPCRGDARKAKGEYHIHPYSSGNQKKLLFPLAERTLPKGLVCDGCNNYFGKEIEVHITNHPYIKQCNAFYARRTRKNKEHTFISGTTRIYRDASGERIIDGGAVDADGAYTFPIPSTANVNNRFVSRAIHKIGFEYLMREIYDKHGADEVIRISKKKPFIAIAKYIRMPTPQEYRPYGVEIGGATGVGVMPMYWENNDGSIEKIFNEYIGFIVLFPGARFSGTLSAKPGKLNEMIADIDKYDALKNYITTRTIFNEP